MARKSSTKVKRASKVTVTAAERAVAQRRRAVSDVADGIDLPIAQRDIDGLAITKTAMVDGHKRPRDFTLRKLTRVEKLRKAGVLEKHEADACEIYADVAEMAWATNGCTANYGGVGSGDYTKAALRLGIVTNEIADARKSHRFMAKAVPGQYRTIFEAVICHNASIASVAGERYSALGRSQREHKTRAIVKLCANLVHGVIAHRLPIEGIAAPASVQPAADLPIPVEDRPRVTDAILAKITGSSTMIAVAAIVAHDIRRELGIDGDEIQIAGLPVVVQESWVTGWMVQ